MKPTLEQRQAGTQKLLAELAKLKGATVKDFNIVFPSGARVCLGIDYRSHGEISFNDSYPILELARDGKGQIILWETTHIFRVDNPIKAGFTFVLGEEEKIAKRLAKHELFDKIEAWHVSCLERARGYDDMARKEYHAEKLAEKYGREIFMKRRGDELAVSIPANEKILVGLLKLLKENGGLND